MSIESTCDHGKLIFEKCESCDKCEHYIEEPKSNCMICYPGLKMMQTHCGD